MRVRVWWVRVRVEFEVPTPNPYPYPRYDGFYLIKLSFKNIILLLFYINEEGKTPPHCIRSCSAWLVAVMKVVDHGGHSSEGGVEEWC